MVDITMIVQAILPLAGAVILPWLIPWVKSKTTAEQRRLSQRIVRTAVHAAEQVFSGPGRGEAKLAYVQKRLEGEKLKPDTAAVYDMIEAAVLEMAARRDREPPMA